MKKLYVLLFINILILSTLNSCDDDSSTSSKPRLLPGATGSYWLYERFPLDEYKERIKDSIAYDSMAVTGKTEVLGKTPSIYTTYSKTDDTGYEYYSEMYLIEEDQTILSHTKFLNDMFAMDSLALDLPVDITLEFEEKWITIINPNEDTWDAGTIELVPINLVIFNLSGSLDIQGTRGAESEYTIGYEKVYPKEYILELNYEIEISYMFEPFTVEGTRLYHVFFVEDVGILKTYLEPMTQTIELNGEEYTLKFTGEETELRSYKLAD